jgi:hypothetical protein
MRVLSPGNGFDLVGIIPGESATAKEKTDSQGAGVNQAPSLGRQKDEGIADCGSLSGSDQVLPSGLGLQFQHSVFNHGVGIPDGRHPD